MNLNITTCQTSILVKWFVPAFSSGAEESIKSSREQERGPGTSHPQLDLWEGNGANNLEK